MATFVENNDEWFEVFEEGRTIAVCSWKDAEAIVRNHNAAAALAAAERAHAEEVERLKAALGEIREQVEEIRQCVSHFYVHNIMRPELHRFSGPISIIARMAEGALAVLAAEPRAADAGGGG